MTAKNIKSCIVAVWLGCAPAGSAHATELSQAWELEGFKNPESVVYDARRDVLYVSNVNGNPPEKDGNGFISRVSPEGKMLDAQWVSGLNAPKGMALRDGRLYVADIDVLVEIDIKKAEIVKRHSAPAAKFLNDVTLDKAGNVYVSDTLDDAIYRLARDEFSLWLKTPELMSPNGLYAERGRIVMGAWGVRTEGFTTTTPGHLKTISLAGKRVASLGDGAPVGNLDGVEADGRGGYYVTDWMAGMLFRIDQTGKAELLLQLAPGSADLSYVASKKLLLIPMMQTDRLLAYKIR